MKLEHPILKTNLKRRRSRNISVGQLAIGGDAAISVQSMTKTKTSDVAATVAQILQLEEAGCHLIRVAVPDQPSAQALALIKKQIHIPLIADIHFDHRLAMQALAAGVDKLRLNPGTLSEPGAIRQVLELARAKNIPVRIGANSGSIERDLLAKYGEPCAAALVESILRQIDRCEKVGFDRLVLSAKASDVETTIAAYEMLAANTDYPLHIGVTAAGSYGGGLIKSAIGIGTLLRQGIGDTIRVSLSADPVLEVRAGHDLLRTLGLNSTGVNLISCPGCGRQQMDLLPIIQEFEKQTAAVQKPVTVAIMGCVVNGPGEARAADIGVACGRGRAVLFQRGVACKTINAESIVAELLAALADFDALSANSS